MNQKANFITFIGAPNVGKSTLLNRLMDQKISIVTHKAQTTRTSIKGIRIFGDTQLVLIDTPGLFNVKTYTDKLMVDCAWQMIYGTDYVCVLVEAKNALKEYNKKIINNLKKEKIRTILIINKIDKTPRMELLAITQELNALHDFEQTFMISALKGDGTDDLIKYFCSTATAQPWPFAEDDITTAPIKFSIAEIVREKLLWYTNQEVPYTTKIEVEHWEKKEKIEVISMLILVRDKNHKKIILGAQGSLMKKIGTQSRLEIESLLGRKVYLNMHIKITGIDKIDQHKIV